MTVRRKDLLCRTLYCRSQFPQVAVLLIFFFFALVQPPYTEKEMSLVVSLPSNYLVLSNRIIYILIPRQLMPAYKP